MNQISYMTTKHQSTASVNRQTVKRSFNSSSLPCVGACACVRAFHDAEHWVMIRFSPRLGLNYSITTRCPSWATKANTMQITRWEMYIESVMLTIKNIPKWKNTFYFNRSKWLNSLYVLRICWKRLSVHVYCCINTEPKYLPPISWMCWHLCSDCVSLSSESQEDWRYFRTEWLLELSHMNEA